MHDKDLIRPRLTKRQRHRISAILLMHVLLLAIIASTTWWIADGMAAAMCFLSAAIGFFGALKFSAAVISGDPTIALRIFGNHLKLPNTQND